MYGLRLHLECQMTDWSVWEPRTATCWLNATVSPFVGVGDCYRLERVMEPGSFNSSAFQRIAGFSLVGFAVLLGVAGGLRPGAGVEDASSAIQTIADNNGDAGRSSISLLR